MATSYPSHLLSASAHLQTSSKLALGITAHSPFLPSLKDSSQFIKTHSFPLTVKSNGLFKKVGPKISRVVKMDAGQSGDPEKISMVYLTEKAKKVWDSAPQPVKSFPWNHARDNFIQLILDLILAVVKFLFVPLLAVTSLSELSYCAHERKLFLTPYPLLIGMAVAGVLEKTALELSPVLKETEVPWHLIAIGIFFTLLKLPGPYYPYWGRIFIPHIANGGLWRTLWFAFLWCRRPRKGLGMRWQQNSVNDSHSQPNQVL